MRPGGKPLADRGHNPCLDAGQRPRKFNKINTAKTAAVDNGLIVPGDAKQVQGVDVPQTDVLQPGYDRVRKALATSARKGQRCPSAAARRRWLTVTRNETLHRIPNDRSPATGLVRKGNVVVATGRAGAWARVRTWRNETGWMPRDSLTRYAAR